MNRKKVSIVFLMVLLILFPAVFFIFANKDMGLDRIRKELDRSFSQILGCCYVAESLHGNPLRGYEALDVKVLSEEDGQEILHAGSIRIKMGISSILKGKTLIKDLSIRDSSVDLDLALDVLMDMTPGIPNKRIHLQSLSIRNSVIEGSRGQMKIQQGSLEIDETLDSLTTEIRAEFNGQPFRGRASLSKSEKGLLINDLVLTSGETAVELSGEVGKYVNLAGNLSTPDISFLSRVLPYTRSARMKGGVDSTLEITGMVPDLHIEGVMQAHDFSVVDFLFNSGVGHWSYLSSQKELLIEDIYAKGFGSPVNGKMSFLFPGGPLHARLELSGKDLEVEKWYKPLKWLSFAEGKIGDLQVLLEGPLRKLTGEVRFSSPYEVILSGNRLKDTEALIRIKDGKDLSFNGQGKWYDSGIQGSGKITITKPSSLLDMEFETTDLNIPSLKEDFPQVGILGLQGSLAGNIHVEGKSGNLTTTGDFRSEKVRLDTEILEKVNFTFLHEGTTTSITSFSAKWQNSPLNMNGSFEDLLGSSPEGDLSITSSSLSLPARGNLRLENLKVAAQYGGNTLSIGSLTSAIAGGKLDLQGTVTLGTEEKADFSLKGKARGLKMASLAKDLNLSIPVEGTADSELSISGNLSRPVIEMEMQTDGLNLSGLPLTNLRASLKNRDDILFVKGLKAQVWKAPLALSGTISWQEKDANQMDLKASVKELELSSIIEKPFPALAIGGLVSSDISITGQTGQTSIEINSFSEKITLGGMNFSEVSLLTQPSEEGAQEYLLTAHVGESPVEVTGLVNYGASGWDITLNAEGKALDSKSLLQQVGKSLSNTLTGPFDLTYSGKLSEGRLEGEGALRSQGLSFHGMKLDTLTVPFSFRKNSLVSSNGKASLYGANALFDGHLDLGEGIWDANLDLRNADLEMLTMDLPDFKGKLTGNADMSLSLSGMIGKVYLLHGNGSLQVGKGALSGMDTIAKISKDGHIPYQGIDARYNVDGRNIYLMPGSRISAPPESSIYKYLSFSGNVGSTNQPMNLKGSGNVNVQALGAFLGAIEGVVAGVNGGGNQVVLQDLLSGLVSSYTSKDFRRISFELRGTWDKPDLSNIEILSEEEFSPIPAENGDDDNFNPEDIRFEVKFPTGEGTDNSTSAGDQFKQQVMDNLLKQIFPTDDDDQGNSN